MKIKKTPDLSKNNKDIKKNPTVYQDNIADGEMRRGFLRENKEHREIFGKHYTGNDGTTTAVYSNRAVHFLDPDEQTFKEIDNSLQDNGDSFETRANSFKTRFHKHTLDGKVFEITKKGCKVGLTSLDASKCGCALENCAYHEHNDWQNKGEVILKNVKDNVDIQYITDSDRVKENIIIHNKCVNYEFGFNLNVENLDIVPVDNGKVFELRNKETSAVEFIIPEPFMTDAEGGYSNLVHYEFDQQTETECKLKVIADTEWINTENRVFPVIIDPQIVIPDHTSFFSHENYYAQDVHSSRNQIWTYPEYLYVGARDGNDWNTGKLIIKKSLLNFSPPKFCNVIVKIRANSYTGSGAVQCKLMDSQKISYPIFTANEYTAIDITEVFAAASGDFGVNFEPMSSGYLKLDVNTAFPPILEIEYLTNYDAIPMKKRFSLAGGLSGDLTIGMGEMVVGFSDINAGNSILPLNISHAYKKSDSDYNIGKDWRLNIHQTLKKNTLNKDVDYVYTDENGEKHGFIETYYYFDSNGNKTIVSKSDVNVELDGKLTYIAGLDKDGSGTIYEIHKEQRTVTGLKLLTKIEETINGKILGTDALEQRSEEVQRYENEIEQIKNSIEDLIQTQYAEATQEEFNALIAANKDVEEKTLAYQNMTSKSLPDYYKNLYGEDDGLNYRENVFEKQSELYEKTKKKHAEIGGFDIVSLPLLPPAISWNSNKLRFTYVNSDGKNFIKQNSLNEFKTITNTPSDDKYNGPTMPEFVTASYYRNKFEDDCAIIQQDLQQNSFSFELINFYNQKELINAQNNLKQKEDAYKTNHNVPDRTDTVFARAKKALREQCKLLAIKESEFARMKLRLPTVYLISNDNVYLCFNENGNLCAITDTYDNVISIEYDYISSYSGKRFVISKIHNGERKTKLKYNYLNQLESINAYDGKRTKYTYYANGSLKNVEFFDGNTIEFKYNSVCDITEIFSSKDKTNSVLTYNNSCKITGITNNSDVSKITDEKTDQSNTSTNPISIATISYNNNGNEVIVTVDNKPEYYYLDSKWNGIGGCAKFMNNTDSEPLSFTKRVYDTNGNLDWTFSIKEKSNTKVAYSNSSSYNNTNNSIGISTVSTNLTGGSTAYMFSAFATLPATATVKPEQYLTTFRSNEPALINPRFGLRAVVNYTTGNTVTFFVSGDYNNKYKQFIALPITIDTKRTLSSIQLYFDYLGNTGTATISDIRLTPAEWNYTEFDAFGAATQSKNSAILLNKSGSTYTYADSVVDYENDNEHRCIKETETRTLTGDTSEPKKAIKKYFYNDFGQVARTESYIGGEEATAGISVSESIFNDKGIKIKEVSYNSLDSSTKFYSESETAEDGKTTADIDETSENKTTYEYVDGKNIVKTATSPSGSKFGYGHDYEGNVTAITQSTEEGESNTTSMHSNCGVVTKLTSGLHTVNYEYDGKRRKTRVVLDDDKDGAVEYTYEQAASNNGYVDKTTTTKNCVKSETRTDKHGNLLTLSINGSKYITNEFEADGRQNKSTDNITGSVMTYKYDPVITDRLDSVAKTAGGTNVAEIIETNGYNAIGQTIKRAVTGAVSHNYKYFYKITPTRDLDYIELPNTLLYHPQTDVNGRSTGKLLKDGSNNKFGEYVYYRKVGDHGTNMISSMRYGAVRNGKYVIDEGLKYAYDKMGNIAEIWENGKLLAKYTYDSLSRLIREDNKQLNRTYLWTYDNNGNILTKQEAIYSDLHINILSPFKRSTYCYDDKQADRLVGIDVEIDELEPADNCGEIICGENICKGAQKYSEDITYSASGSLRGLPLNYRGTILSWNAIGQLTSANDIAYDYDGYGKRIKKGDIVYTYDLGNRLVKQACHSGQSEESTLEYYYDGNGLNGFKYDNKQYIYRKNAQGDISHIFDIEGTLVVKYLYDAWGNHFCISANGTKIYDSASGVTAGYENHVGVLNPFRYRSYFYDTETGLYSVGLRYFDPEVGRWINADDISELQPDQINGLNLYAYCGSNPVNRIDPTGRAWWHWLVGIAVIAVLAIAVVATAGIAGVGIGAAFGAGFAGGAIGVGASGLAVTIAAGAFAGAVVGAGIGLVTGALIGGVSSAIGGGSFWQGALDGAASGFMMGAITGAITGGLRGAIAFKNSSPLFRAVNSSEANGISKTGQFSLKNGAYEGKQFGLRLSETRAYANLEFNNGMYNSIVATRVPNSVLNQFTRTATDAFVFKSGVITVASGQMGLLNNAIKFIMFFAL